MGTPQENCGGTALAPVEAVHAARVVRPDPLQSRDVGFDSNGHLGFKPWGTRVRHLLAPPLRPWRMRVPGSICLLGIIGLSAGCSTVVSKAGLNAAVEVQIGNPYSGVRFNLKSWLCLPSVAKGYSPALKLLFLPVSAALLLIDLPVSAVADTAMFPVDFMVTPRAKPIRPLGDECD